MSAVVQRAAGNLPTLLLLHGRGGFEHDLLDLAAMVAPGWGVIAPRGPEREGNGYAWFQHQAIGVPVIESLDVRLHETAEVAAGLARDAGVRLPMVAVGFSNGGMMAGALGCARPDLVGGVVLLSSTYPLPSHIYDMGGLCGTPVLALAGGADAVHPREVHAAGVAAYSGAGAAVTAAVDPDAGHEVSTEQVHVMRTWLGEHPPARGPV